MKHGVLLINLGTPDSADTPAVRRYLREFLADRRVITLPAPLRYLLLYGVILPFRSKKTAHAYQQIWTAEGSPLRYYSQQLCNKLQTRLGEHHHVVVGMRYGTPSIKAALHQLQDCELITVLPLYPQYSSAATGSSIQNVLETLAPWTVFPSMHMIRDFHQHPSYIHAQAEQIRPYVSDHEYVLFSYHGLPERHLMDSGCKQICIGACPAHANPNCYRAQCQQTTALIANTLGLTAMTHSTAFQSRLGKTPWIKPYTDHVLADLAAQGIKRLAIACPSFVTDCLETLEEIGIRAKAEWLALGGEQCTLIPCMNAQESWVEAIADIVKSHKCTIHRV